MRNLLCAVTAVAALLLASSRVEPQTSPERSSPELSKLPYIAVHNPQFISAPEATFMHAGDRVIGVIIGKTAKAYPAGIVSQHGLVEDQTPSGPIAITW